MIKDGFGLYALPYWHKGPFCPEQAPKSLHLGRETLARNGNLEPGHSAKHNACTCPIHKSQKI